MAAFNVKTQPNSLSVKPGGTGSIMVAVSNLAGQPVIGVVQGMLTPAANTGWLESPPDLQRRYEADPVATVNYVFTVRVPADAKEQTLMFKAIAWNAVTPDDTKAESQPVTITVTSTPIVVPPVTPIYKRWWFWLIVGLVVLAIVGGIIWATRKRGVPNVVGNTPAEATQKLKKAGFAPVNSIDSVGKQDKDTNTVMGQVPNAGDTLPEKKNRGKTPATIVVNRQGVDIPAGLANLEYADAANQLQAVGLGVRFSARHTVVQSQVGKVYTTVPAPGTKVPRGSTVDLVIYRTQIILTCPPFCVIQPRNPVRVLPEGVLTPNQ